MATMNVKDATGQVVPVEKRLPPGTAAASASGPVTLSTEDKIKLDAIATAIAGLSVGGPTGGATETTLGAINDKTPALGQALAAASVPVVLPAAQITALTPPAAITGFATEVSLAAAAASLNALDDWDESDRAKVNTIAGQAGVAAGAGAVSASTQRMTLASDDPAVAALGVKVTSVAALEAGGTGIIGWLSQLWRDTVAMSAKLPAALGIGAASTALRVVQGQGTLTDRSGSITTGGTAQQLMAANSSRLGWKLQNTSTAGPLYFNATGTASTAGSSFMLAAATATTPGGYYESPPGGQSVGAISILGATTGQTFACREW